MTTERDSKLSESLPLSIYLQLSLSSVFFVFPSLKTHTATHLNTQRLPVAALGEICSRAINLSDRMCVIYVTPQTFISLHLFLLSFYLSRSFQHLSFCCTLSSYVAVCLLISSLLSLRPSPSFHFSSARLFRPVNSVVVVCPALN